MADEALAGVLTSAPPESAVGVLTDTHANPPEPKAPVDDDDTTSTSSSSSDGEDYTGAHPQVAEWRVDSTRSNGGVPLELLWNGDEDAGVSALQKLRNQLSQEVLQHYGTQERKDAEVPVADEVVPTCHGVAALADNLKSIGPKNIVMMVVGTRGDLQPFVGIGLVLKSLGHRVRLASHSLYRKIVEECGLEFFPLGGDPKVLSEFVVKHRGVNPGLAISDASEQRKQVRAIVKSTWPACIQPDPGAEPGVSPPGAPFRADVIVSNPPAYGHIHCAEKLQVPLHIVFTMPWTPTEVFAQPFARFTGTSTKSKEHGPLTSTFNWFSYFAMEDLTWMGLRDIIKSFRVKTLKLGRFTWFNNSHGLFHSKVPFTYIWSPSLVPRPYDWQNYIRVVGFVNINVDSVVKFTPPEDIVAFLNAGPPPLYIGFGSLVVDNPKELTAHAVAAILETGVRAIIQKGWGGLGEGLEGDKLPEHVFVLSTGVAHDWLFPRCQALVHHGGAGTTATGLYAAKPTFIVSFFGDQPFWGAACSRAGVGPESVPIDQFTAKKLKEAIRFMLQPSCQRAANLMAEKMQAEDGACGAANHILQTIFDAAQPGHKLKYVRKKDLGQPVHLEETMVDDADDEEDEDESTTETKDSSSFRLKNIVRLPHTFIKGTKNSLGGALRTGSSLMGLKQRTGSQPDLPADATSKHSRSRSSLTGTLDEPAEEGDDAAKPDIMATTRTSILRSFVQLPQAMYRNTRSSSSSQARGERSAGLTTEFAPTSLESGQHEEHAASKGSGAGEMPSGGKPAAGRVRRWSTTFLNGLTEVLDSKEDEATPVAAPEGPAQTSDGPPPRVLERHNSLPDTSSQELEYPGSPAAHRNRSSISNGASGLPSREAVIVELREAGAIGRSINLGGRRTVAARSGRVVAGSGRAVMRGGKAVVGGSRAMVGGSTAMVVSGTRAIFGGLKSTLKALRDVTPGMGSSKDKEEGEEAAAGSAAETKAPPQPQP